MALVSAAHAATSAGIRTQAAWLLRHDQQSKWSLQNEGTIARARSTSKPLPVGRCRIQTSNQAKARPWRSNFEGSALPTKIFEDGVGSYNLRSATLSLRAKALPEASQGDSTSNQQEGDETDEVKIALGLIKNDQIRASRQGRLSACRSLEAAAHNLGQRACSFISALNLCDKLQNDPDLEWPLQSDSRLVIAYREYTRERWDLIHALVDFELGSGMKRFLADWSASELPLLSADRPQDKEAIALFQAAMAKHKSDQAQFKDELKNVEKEEITRNVLRIPPSNWIDWRSRATEIKDAAAEVEESVKAIADPLESYSACIERLSLQSSRAKPSDFRAILQLLADMETQTPSALVEPYKRYHNASRNFFKLVRSANLPK